MMGAERKETGTDLRGAAEEENVYFKMAAWGAIFNKILMKEDVGFPILNDAEAIGMNALFKDTLKDVELLVFGGYPWSNPETTKEGGQRP